MSSSKEEQKETYGLVHERTLAEVERDLEEAAFLLKAWASSEQSDSVRRQELRKREYAQACRLLKQVFADTYRSGKVIRLTISEDSQPVRTQTMRRNSYDFYERGRGGDLEPGQPIILKTHKGLMDLEHRATNVYFGDYRRYLEVADIGRALNSGARLELVDQPAEES